MRNFKENQTIKEREQKGKERAMEKTSQTWKDVDSSQDFVPTPTTDCDKGSDTPCTLETGKIHNPFF